MAKMTEVGAKQVDAIHRTLANRTAQIRDSAHLTDPAKQQALAAAYRDARDKMQVLGEQFAGSTALTDQQLQTRLFGADKVTGADAIAMRDAYTRVAQLETPADAEQLLRMAETTGDDQLARAVAGHAFSLAKDPFFGAGWAGVVDAYATTRPGVEQQINDLVTAQRDDLDTRMQNAMAMYVSKPSEIDAMHDFQIDALADEAPDNLLTFPESL